MTTCGLAQIFLENNYLAQLIVGLSDHSLDGSHCGPKLIIADIEFELKDVNECIHHFSHLLLVKIEARGVEQSVLLEMVQVKLC